MHDNIFVWNIVILEMLLEAGLVYIKTAGLVQIYK